MSTDLTHLTTFRTQAHADAIVALTDSAQLPGLAKQLHEKPFLLLGSGSNVLFADDYPGTVVVNQLRGEHITTENSTSALVRLAAGEIWHDCVCRLSARGLYGLENLALIPGTVGAAPVQNIGAYGVEVADFIDAVEVFDLQLNEWQSMSATDCQFAYRDSIFKREENRRRYVITAVTLRLSKVFSPVLSYQGLQNDTTAPLTPDALLARVITMRQSKLPDPVNTPNAGSFFKNPIITREHLTQLQNSYPDIPFFPVTEHQIKIPAAWLLQTAGFKGLHRDNGAGVYEKHALILVNRGKAHGREIYALACDMMETVKEQFAITITPEVRIVGV